MKLSRSFTEKVELGKRALSEELALRWVSIFIFILAFVSTIPSFFVPLGLPPEADAIDYRIPIIKWIIRHKSYPNWPWSYVDDFPMLAEMLMVPLYWIFPGLARLVPLTFHLLSGLAAGGILFELQKLIPSNKPLQRSTWFLLGGAWIVAFRPMAIQINIFLTDNAATCFALLAFWMILAKKFKLSGIFMGLAMATKYFMWPMSVGFFATLLYLSPKELRWKNFFVFGFILFLLVSPYMIRNYMVNEGNPFFPLLESVFRPSKENLEPWLDGYGRGKTLLAFLLFPYDLLFTNSFIINFYDYTVGKLFLLQAVLAVYFLLRQWYRGKEKIIPILRAKEFKATLILISLHTLLWFFSSQQLRFYSLALCLMDMLFLLAIRFSLPSYWLCLLTLCGALSLLSVQKDSILTGLGVRPQQFEGDYLRAKQCFDRVPEVYNSLVGYIGRDNTLGFFDFEFRFIGWHVYGIQSKQYSQGKPQFIFGMENNKLHQEYEPWPKEKPCLFRLADKGSSN